MDSTPLAGMQDPTSPAGKVGSFQAAPAAPQDLVFEHPLRAVVHLWLEKIKMGSDLKKAQFGDDAADCMRFFNGPYDFLYKREYAKESPNFRMNLDDDEADLPAPTFQMTLNLVAEAVQIFGPVLYHKNPTRQVNPRDVPLPEPGTLALTVQSSDPNVGQAVMQAEMQLQQQQQAQTVQDKARAMLIEWYLNYTPTELELKDHARVCIDETLIKGMSLLWTELYQPQGTKIRLVGSFWDSVDNLVLDPDAEAIDDAKWAARRCVHPVWQVEREYNLPPGSVKANLESYAQQAAVNVDPDGDLNRKRGVSNDLVVYWKIYSKMGVGGRLLGADPAAKQVLEKFGDFAYLVVAEGTPFPLNLPSQMLQQQANDEAILQRLEWPTPFWADDRWPFQPFMFHRVPRQLWPMSHMKPAMGELKFLNWCYSFLASKMRVTCRDFIAIKKSAGEEMVNAILHGKDLTLLKIEQSHGTIKEIVDFLQHPEINGDVWKVIDAVTHNFEKRTGLSELIYGMAAKQMRSAEEAQLRGDQLQVRPDDMASKIEDAMTGVARMEAIACRWHLTADDIRPVMGPVAAVYWQQLVMTQDVYALVRQLQYRIEAGSTKKPNKERDQANLSQAMQSLFQPLFEFAQATGVVDPVNALITDWAKSIGLDASRYLIHVPPPAPDPAQQEAQQSAQQHQQDQHQQQQAHSQQLAHNAQQHQQKLQQAAQQHQQQQQQAKDKAKQQAAAPKKAA